MKLSTNLLLSNCMQVHTMDNTAAGKENFPSSSSAKASDAMLVHESIKEQLKCALCTKLIAAPLVVSCGHMFCGQCLFEYLNKEPMCPTCQMGLRAVPVRCLAVDAIGDSLKASMPAKEREKFAKRVEEGRSAADKVNKVFWWLAPQAVPIGGTMTGQVGLSFANPSTNAAAMPSLQQHQQPQQRSRQHQQHHQHQGKPKRHSSSQVPNGLLLQPSLAFGHNNLHMQQQQQQHAPLFAHPAAQLGLGLTQPSLMGDPGMASLLFAAQHQHQHQLQPDLMAMMQRLYG
jgi:hypothetical protein